MVDSIVNQATSAGASQRHSADITPLIQPGSGVSRLTSDVFILRSDICWCIRCDKPRNRNHLGGRQYRD